MINLGLTPISYRFDYGIGGFTNSSSTTAGLLGSLAVNKTVAGLQPGTTYMWRLVAAGTTASSTGYFTTAASGSSDGWVDRTCSA